MPAAYVKMPHQKFVDTRMAALPEHKRRLVGLLWNEFRRTHPNRRNDGQFFVRILDHVGNNEVPIPRRFVRKWQHHWFGDAPDRLTDRNLERGRQIFEQATCSRCHSFGPGEKKLGPDLTGVTKRFQGSKLLTQIVRPSAEINKDFKTQMILSDAGKMRTGLVIKETDEEVFLARTSGEMNLRSSDRVKLQVDPDRFMWFDPETGENLLKE